MNMMTTTQDAITTSRVLLAQPSRNTTFRECLQLKLFDRLSKACEQAWTKGVGLAAIQIGVPVRFAYYTDEEKPLAPPQFLINPKIIEGKDLVPHRNEGCLSIPDRRFQTWRYSFLVYEKLVNGSMQEFKARGFEALVIQHEIDHMDGVLCCDRVVKPQPPRRNDACPCASGKKFKKCCAVK